MEIIAEHQLTEQLDDKTLRQRLKEQGVDARRLSRFTQLALLGALPLQAHLNSESAVYLGSSFNSPSKFRKMFDNLMEHKKLAYFYERIKNEESNPLSEAELSQFAMALRTDLQENPNNAKGWFMLGQIGIAKNDNQLAYESYGKASQLEPKNMQYKSSYAQLLMRSQDSADKEKGKVLLKELIREDHTNLDALSLLAFSAFEEEDYNMAAMTWGMMLKLIPEDNPRRQMVEKSIDMAMQLMKEAENLQKREQK